MDNETAEITPCTRPNKRFKKVFMEYSSVFMAPVTLFLLLSASRFSYLFNTWTWLWIQLSESGDVAFVPRFFRVKNRGTDETSPPFRQSSSKNGVQMRPVPRFYRVTRSLKTEDKMRPCPPFCNINVILVTPDCYMFLLSLFSSYTIEKN